MANADAARGLTPVGTLSGAPWTDSIRAFYCDSATAIYVGDMVKGNSTAGAAGKVVYGMDLEGVESVEVCGATDNLIYGVVVGFSPLQSDLTKLYRGVSEDRIAYVCTDPLTIYEIQEDSVGNNIAVTQVGHNFDTAYTAGSTTTGRSKVEIDSSDTTGASTAQLRLLGLAKKADNALGDSAKWLVVINEHAFKSTTGTS